MRDIPAAPTLCVWIMKERIYLINLVRSELVWKIHSSNLDEVYTDDNSVNLILKQTEKKMKVRTKYFLRDSFL